MRKVIITLLYVATLSVFALIFNKFVLPNLDYSLQVEVQIMIGIVLGALAFFSQFKDTIELFVTKEGSGEDVIYFDPLQIKSNTININFVKSLPKFSLPRHLYQHWIAEDHVQRQSHSTDTLVYALTVPSYYYIERLPLTMLADYCILLIVITVLIILDYQSIVWAALGIWLARFLWSILKRIRKEVRKFYLITDSRIIMFPEIGPFDGPALPKEIIMSSITSIGTFRYLFRRNLGSIVVRSANDSIEIDCQKNPFAITLLIEEIWTKTRELYQEMRNAEMAKELEGQMKRFVQSKSKTSRKGKSKSANSRLKKQHRT